MDSTFRFLEQQSVDGYNFAIIESSKRFTRYQIVKFFIDNIKDISVFRVNNVYHIEKYDYYTIQWKGKDNSDCH